MDQDDSTTRIPRCYAVIVGVGQRQVFVIDGKTRSFPELTGVAADVEGYRQLLHRVMPQGIDQLWELTTPGDTAPRRILDTMKKAADACDSGDVLFIALAGHGYQVKDRGGDERDRMDEVFVATDGLISDDNFGSVWEPLKGKDVRVVSFLDCCRADDLLLETLGPPPGPETIHRPDVRKITRSDQKWHHISFTAASAIDAYEVPTPDGAEVRGALSLAVEESWGPTVTYDTWFDKVNQLVQEKAPKQQPRLYVAGPDPQTILGMQPL